ncbi:spore coat protein [Clostridium botulinum]|uniref:Spore coat protein n=1 Tax=Clostridium botulinum TaxID=1491 RepID=A0AAU8YVV4_CLOBO|nr:spore coat protein [Clostridium sporogenes]AVP64653.1 spore coat protein [Clostridium botulinum]MCF4016177.1 spore coat protein [Clostridium sporogenes]MDU1419834.1 spore coat protein [Clostridium botulinum]NFG03277.1 spore coat protein [Clostridium sporogenes]
MNNRDFLHDSLQDEMMLQSMYNKYMMEISNPEVRQLFTQLRDLKMKNISQLQQEIKTMMGQGKA